MHCARPIHVCDDTGKSFDPVRKLLNKFKSLTDVVCFDSSLSYLQLSFHYLNVMNKKGHVMLFHLFPQDLRINATG